MTIKRGSDEKQWAPTWSASLPLTILVAMAQPCYAYDVPTHERILTERAAILLHKQSGQNYEELLNSDLLHGTNHQDDGSNFFEHFYRPTDGAGLWVNPLRGAAPSNTSALSRLLGQSAANNNPYFATAIAQYNLGNKSLAYRELGNALHLATQDMFSPPHTHNDVHANATESCPIPGFPYLCGPNFAKKGYETWSSETFNDNLTDPRADGSQAAPFVEFLLPTPDDIGMILKRNAEVVYRASRIPGTLPQTANTSAAGRLGEMFPNQLMATPGEGPRAAGAFGLSRAPRARRNL